MLERRSLEALLDTVRSGRSRVLVVRGEAGIGKSALLQHLVEQAHGFTVHRATGVQSEMELAFAALHQLCASMLDRLDTLPDPQRDAAASAFGLRTGSAPDRLLIGLAVLNLLSAASDERPLLLVVDDAQWLDQSSALALGFVARRLLADPVCTVFATREQSDDLTDLPEMLIDRLDDRDAQTLLSSVMLVPLDERVRDRIVAETQGNPLALVEWPQGLTAGQLAGGFGMAAIPMTGQIEERFRRRLGELPARTQQFLTIAAAEPTGDSGIVWRAASAQGIDPHDATPAVEAGLVDIGVLVRFRHPLVRSAAYGAVPLSDRQAAHRDLARATDVEADPDRQAWHRALGSPGPDEEIADALEASADRARGRGGLIAAGALLERSVALSLDAEKRATRILAAAEAYLEAGSYDRVGTLLAFADASMQTDTDHARLALIRARREYVSGNFVEAPALLLGAARRLEPLDAALAADTYLWAMTAATVAGNFIRGTTLYDIARAACASPASPDPRAQESLVAGVAHTVVDGPAAGAAALRRMIDLLSAEPAAAEALHRSGNAQPAASLLWDDESMHNLTVQHVAATRAIGGLTMLPWALNVLGYNLTLEGDLTQADALLAEASQVAQLTRGEGLLWGHAVLAGWRADADAPRRIDGLTNMARAARTALFLKYGLWARAVLHNSRGEYEQAFAASTEVLTHPFDWGSQLFLSERIEAAVRCAKRSDAEETLERLRLSTEASGSDWAIGVQRGSEALLAGGAAAEELYRESIAKLSSTKRRPQLARTHLLFGEWLRRDNRRLDAREQLRTAHEMFAAMGMQGFSERARLELLATGEKVRKRTPDSITEFTPQEAQIARLAAEGRTNPEIGAQLFISPRTVEWHLRKVFTKLNITSRRELSGALAQDRV